MDSHGTCAQFSSPNLWLSPTSHEPSVVSPRGFHSFTFNKCLLSAF